MITIPTGTLTLIVLAFVVILFAIAWAGFQMGVEYEERREQLRRGHRLVPVYVGTGYNGWKCSCGEKGLTYTSAQVHLVDALKYDALGRNGG